jgi:hypothetical protein
LNTDKITFVQKFFCPPKRLKNCASIWLLDNLLTKAPRTTDND